MKEAGSTGVGEVEQVGGGEGGDGEGRGGEGGGGGKVVGGRRW